ncbi:MAG: DUF1318 domain-containing protein [Candidatus Hydrogenedentota bacterium]
MKRSFIYAMFVAVIAMTTAGCLPTQTIIVRFEDLKSDFIALESSLETNDWAKFDWDKMIITISSKYLPVSTQPVALGAFETPTKNSQPAKSEPSVAADQPDLDLKRIEITDTITQIMRRRQARLQVVKNLKKTGVIGESNVGTLMPPKGGSLLTLEESIRKSVTDENTDRRLLFIEILRQRGLGEDQIDRVARTFAQAQRELADPGVWVQFDDGNWQQA